MIYTTRKTIDLWDVEVDYGYGDGFETVFTATSRSQAKKIKADYIRNDSSAKDIRIRSYREKRNFCGDLIFSVWVKNGEKILKYILDSKKIADNKYSATSYKFFEASLKVVLETGFSAYFKNHSAEYGKVSMQYSSLYELYTTFNDGKMPRIIEDVKSIDNTIPQGMYIVKLRGDEE